MYCIDRVCTLKDCKPTLIHESLNRVKTKHAKNTFGVKLNEVAENFFNNVNSAFAKPAFAVC